MQGSTVYDTPFQTEPIQNRSNPSIVLYLKPRRRRRRRRRPHFRPPSLAPAKRLAGNMLLQASHQRPIGKASRGPGGTSSSLPRHRPGPGIQSRRRRRRQR